jgi:hypothetical protein
MFQQLRGGLPGLGWHALLLLADALDAAVG